MPQSNAQTPEDLFPDLFQAIRAEPRLTAICGKPLKVKPQSGLTNRVYQIEAGKGTFFLRLPRTETAGMIDRHAEAHNLACAADLELALPPLFCDPGTGILVTRSVQELSETPEDLATQLGVAIGKLHASRGSFEGLLDADEVFMAQRSTLSGQSKLWNEMAALDHALEEVRVRFERDPKPPLVPSHGDLSPGNCLATAEKLWLIDWEYSGMADPAWDLAYAILEHEFSPEQETEFLTAYRDRGGAIHCPSADGLQIMKAKCDAVSALWALEQVSNGRDQATFLPFARQRRDRALTGLKALS